MGESERQNQETFADEHLGIDNEQQQLHPGAKQQLKSHIIVVAVKAMPNSSISFCDPT